MFELALGRSTDSLFLPHPFPHLKGIPAAWALPQSRAFLQPVPCHNLEHPAAWALPQSRAFQQRGPCHNLEHSCSVGPAII